MRVKTKGDGSCVPFPLLLSDPFVLLMILHELQYITNTISALKVMESERKNLYPDIFTGLPPSTKALRRSTFGSLIFWGCTAFS
jgi:hypothetical protein